MAAKQTRRCVSLSRPVYDRLRSYCVQENLSMSSVVERVLLVLLEKADVIKAQAPHVSAEAAPAKKTRDTRPENRVGNVRTF